MIRNLSVNRESASPGETVHLEIAGRAPFEVTFGCFVDDPPPPGFRDCPACRTYRITASSWGFEVSDSWQGFNGRLDITVADADGDEKAISLQVVGRLDRGVGLTASY